jgi:hypothetical protein
MIGRGILSYSFANHSSAIAPRFVSRSVEEFARAEKLHVPGAFAR